MFILKVDKYQEPEYYGFHTEEILHDFLESRLLGLMVDPSVGNSRVVQYLKEKHYQAAMAEWSETETEYLTVIEVQPILDGSFREDLEGLRDRFYHTPNKK